MSRASTAPQSSRMRSASVLLPWSTWAMIARQRRRSWRVTVAFSPAGTAVTALTGRDVRRRLDSGAECRRGPCYPLSVPRNTLGDSRVANIKGQIKRNRQNEKRRAQQGRPLRAQDPREGRQGRRRRQSRGRAGSAPPGPEAPRQSSCRRSDPQERRSPAHLSPHEAGVKEGLTTPGGREAALERLALASARSGGEAGQAGDQHLHHCTRRDRALALQVEVGPHQVVERLAKPVGPEHPRLAQPEARERGFIRPNAAAASSFVVMAGSSRRTSRR